MQAEGRSASQGRARCVDGNEDTRKRHNLAIERRSSQLGLRESVTDNKKQV